MSDENQESEKLESTEEKQQSEDSAEDVGEFTEVTLTAPMEELTGPNKDPRENNEESENDIGEFTEVTLAAPIDDLEDKTDVKNLKAEINKENKDESFSTEETDKSAKKGEPEEPTDPLGGKVSEHSLGLAEGNDTEFKWYICHSLTGHENKVAKALRERIFNHKMTSSFAEIYIPEEKVVSNVRGKKRTMKKKFFPGYILLKMIMNDHTWNLVKNTDKITGFIGGVKGKPSPITDDEAASLLNQHKEGRSQTRTKVSLVEGDSVKVIEGPFNSFVGTVDQVNDKGKIRVQVSIFGRPTPVELDHTQVEKLIS